jgi:hypothetical protein
VQLPTCTPENQNGREPKLAAFLLPKLFRFATVTSYAYIDQPTAPMSLPSNDFSERKVLMRLPIRCLIASIVVAGFSSAAMAEQVENPQYASWSKFKPGTTVTYKVNSETKMQGMPDPMKSEMTMSTKLVEVKPDELTIEVTNKMMAGGQEMAMPATTQKVPAKIEKTATPAPDAKVEIKDQKDGKDTVEVGGKKYDAATHEQTMVMKEPAMTTVSKTWTSKEVPGGLVKSETKSSGSMDSTSTMTLVEFTEGK